MVDLRAEKGTALLVLAWIGLAWIGLACMGPASGQGAPSAADALFSVREVAVDETAQNAALARERALASGQRLAFARLIERLTMPADRLRLPAIDDGELQGLVAGLEIGAERTSAVRYLASLTVRFKPAGVRQRLAAAAVPMVETPSAPMLVLPVFLADGVAQLWEDANPWRQAWNTAPAALDLVPLVLPVGDIADTADIGAEQAIKGEAERLEAIARRYGAAETIVAEAAIVVDAATNQTMLQVTATRHGGTRVPAVVENLAIADEGALGTVLLQAVALVQREVEDAWKRAHLVMPGDDQRLMVSVPIEGLADWLDMRRRLSGVTMLRRSTLLALSQREALLDLGFVGNSQQLRAALAQSRLDLTNEGVAWTLRPAEAARPQIPPSPQPASQPAEPPATQPNQE